MEQIEWKDEYSVNHHEFDEHHKAFIQHYNRLVDIVTSQAATEEFLARVIEDLIEYAETHFSAEEHFLKINRYPEFDSHQRQHNEIKNYLQALKGEFGKGKRELEEVILYFVKNWFIQHIRGSDKKYAEYFKAMGLDFNG